MPNTRTVTRTVIVNRARMLRAEITQIINEAAHWNRMHPNELPIDPDQHGQLRAIADSIDAMLAKEKT